MIMEFDPRYDLHLRTRIFGTVDVERRLDPDPAIQRLLDEEQLVTWLLSVGPWDVIAHLTWRDRVVPFPGKKPWTNRGRTQVLGVAEFSAARGVDSFMRDLPGVSYFYSVEKNPSRDGHHVHMLWGDCHGVYRKEQWAKWLKLHGRARIEPVNSDRDVAGYASKYVMKIPCWWNINLRWHRWNNELPSRSQVDNGRVSFPQSPGSQCEPGAGERVVGSDFNIPPSKVFAAEAHERIQHWKEVSPGIWEPTERPINETSA
jgi:hypothetical protein